jgi:hypothetical protein
MPSRGDVEAARPGILRRGAALNEQVGLAAVRAVDPAVEALVPEPPAMSLALPRDLAGRSPEPVENVHPLVHASKGSI